MPAPKKAVGEKPLEPRMNANERKEQIEIQAKKKGRLITGPLGMGENETQNLYSRHDAKLPGNMQNRYIGQ